MPDVCLLFLKMDRVFSPKHAWKKGLKVGDDFKYVFCIFITTWENDPIWRAQHIFQMGYNLTNNWKSWWFWWQHMLQKDPPRLCNHMASWFACFSDGFEGLECGGSAGWTALGGVLRSQMCIWSFSNLHNTCLYFETRYSYILNLYRYMSVYIIYMYVIGVCTYVSIAHTPASNW